MKSFFKKTAGKINNSKIVKKLEGASMNISTKVKEYVQKETKPKSEIIFILENATGNNGNIVPIYLLDSIAESSYNIESYEEIILFIFDKLKQQNIKSSNPVIRTLLIVDYLLKYGASACVDEFTDNIDLFKTFIQYSHSKNVDKNENVRQKARHLVKLLNNKEQLFQEKKMALQVKQKFKNQKMKGINGMGSVKSSEEENKEDIQQRQNQNSRKEKVLLNMQDFVENYVFKYLDKVNDNLDEIQGDFNITVEAYIDYVKFKYFNKNGDENGKYTDDNMPDTCIELEDNNIEESISSFEKIQKLKKLKQEKLQQEQEKYENKQQQQEIQQIDLLNLEDNDITEDKEDIVDNKIQYNLQEEQTIQKSNNNEDFTKQQEKKEQQDLYDINLL